jgi:ABC-type glycerol-3-phosphate transport system substrate-binding protein
VTFSLQYIPQDDLYATYEEASYNGTGPSLLLGPAKWGVPLIEEKLITDLTSYVPPIYLSSINPAALSSGKYQESLISLPLSQNGSVMFRNTLILKDAPATFDDLKTFSHTVTHGGLVGSYLERGSQFSSADIVGLGGQIMDEAGYPAFNDEFGMEWFQLLGDYDVAGAVTFNTNWDLEMFKHGRVGTIIDGTWNITYLSQILGADNLAIDPWPTYGTGHLSGWVEADSVFLNANVTGDDRFAALAFMGYLLDPDVQVRLAEVGHIPSVTDAQPRNPLIKQAMTAFSRGAAYPRNISDEVLSIYQHELDTAIYSVFVKGVNPSEALKLASDNIVIQLENLPSEP